MNDEIILVCQCRVPAWASAEHLFRGLALLPAILHPDIIRYHRLEDRVARLIARLLVRKALSERGFVKESSLESWQKGANGRPYIKGCTADFSISHSNPWVVAAVSSVCKVGIDVEVYRSMDVRDFFPYLTAGEIADISRSRQPGVDMLNFWSLREAILKADGRGLLAPEASIQDIGSLVAPGGNPWAIERFDLLDGCLHLAYEEGDVAFCRKDWGFSELLSG